MEIFFPVMLLMLHTMLVVAFMGYRRYTAVSKQQVDPEYYKLYVGEESEDCRVVSRHVINLLETPPLFYLAVIIAFVTNQTGTMLLALAWAYVALRLIHTSIHLGSNVVIQRFRVYVLSMLVLMIFLCLIAYGLLSAS